MFQHVIGQTSKKKTAPTIQHRSDKLQGSLPQEAFRMAHTHVTTARHTSVLQQN